MGEHPSLTVSFQGKTISRLEFTYFQESRFMINLDVLIEGHPSELDLQVSTDDEWLIATPLELVVRAGTPVSLSVSADSRIWEVTGDYQSTIRFMSKAPGALPLSHELPVLIHHVSRQEEKEKSRFLKRSGQESRHVSNDKIEEESEHRCNQCGVLLPDKRPFCAVCRKAGAQADDAGHAWKKDFSDSLQYICSFVHTWPALWAALAVVLCISLIALSLSVSRTDKAKITGSGSLSITSEPPGAWVIFLQNEYAMTQTPLKISSCPAGLHKIHLQRENCGGGDLLHQIEIKPNVENSFNFKLEKQGKLSVRSIPTGRSIMLDGKDTGKDTPALLEGIAIGPHRVTLHDSLELEKARVFPVTVQWGEEASLFSVMDSSLSGVSLLCEEGARVYTDGVYCGKTPLPPMMIKPGLHAITVLMGRCLPWKQTLPFIAGEVMELTVEPVKQGELALEGDEGGALFVNSDLYGALPGKILVAPGKKILAKVIAPDGRTWKKSYILAPGEYRRDRVKFPARPSPAMVQKPVAGFVPGVAQEPLIRGSFFDFNLALHFPPRSWNAVETLYDDVDGDGGEEMLMVLENKKNRSSAGYPLFLFAIKKMDGAYQLHNLRGPTIGAIGMGELLSLYVLRADDFGYREVQYVCGDKRGRVTSKGSFIIYKGKLSNPSWSARAVE